MRKELREKYIEAVIGINKPRDFSILEYQALNPQATYSEIRQNLNLEIAEARIGLIVTDNWDIVLKLFAGMNYLAMPEGRAYERARAFFRKKSKGIETRKDPLDILNDMEDSGIKIDASQHNHFTLEVKKGDDQNIRTARSAVSDIRG